ncbi:hypothetical protein [Streptomyces sp. URMC 129]|uniref:hypothetical protein n=1 Tax=Streptomyces sp. URMC 129 TaxID=3423407 RepID=UPI003F1B3892
MLPARPDETILRATITAPLPHHFPDLYDPTTGRTVIPRRVTLSLTRLHTPERARQWAYVAVAGPRRLVSGTAGKTITSASWDDLIVEGSYGAARRPEWLTGWLAVNLPDGWPPALLALADSDVAAAVSVRALTAMERDR